MEQKKSMSPATKIALLIVSGFFVLLLVACMTIYGMVTNVYNNYKIKDIDANAKWAEVQNQYKRRSDLIPALVATVQGEANFEKSTLTDVISARARANSIQLTPEALKDPEAMKQFTQRQGDFTNALSKLMMLTENYPQLRANDSFRNIQAELSGTENRIGVARNRYINSVSSVNTTISTFPGNVIAGFFQLKERPQLTFEDADQIKNAPKVEFK